MKSYLSCILLVISSMGFSQNYTPLLGNYNEWQFSTCYNGCITDTYFTEGDTLVDNKNYKVLDGYHYISRTFLLREEVTTKKVFLNLIQPKGNTEYLLYDFSMNVGDSIDMKNPISPFVENAGYYQLDSIVSTPINNKNHRFFYLSPTPSNTTSSNPAIWVEGIGSLSLINAPSGKPDFNEAGKLSCFFKEGSLYYSDLTVVSACSPNVLEIANDRQEASQPEIIKLAEHHYQLTHAMNISSVHIFDLTGQKIKEMTNKDGDKVNINLSGYPSGIYLMVVTSNNQRHTTFKILLEEVF